MLEPDSVKWHRFFVCRFALSYYGVKWHTKMMVLAIAYFLYVSNHA